MTGCDAWFISDFSVWIHMLEPDPGITMWTQFETSVSQISKYLCFLVFMTGGLINLLTHLQNSMKASRFNHRKRHKSLWVSIMKGYERHLAWKLPDQTYRATYCGESGPAWWCSGENSKKVLGSNPLPAGALLCGVTCFPCACVGSLVVLWLSPTIQRER